MCTNLAYLRDFFVWENISRQLFFLRQSARAKSKHMALTACCLKKLRAKFQRKTAVGSAGKIQLTNVFTDAQAFLPRRDSHDNGSGLL